MRQVAASYSSRVNLDAYFARIGWSGEPEIAGLLAHHMRAIPFENFDVLLGRPPSLELDALEDKLVTRRRGGYCYEHSTLFAAVLRELGHDVRLHSARVVMMTPREQAPRTHMFLSLGYDVLDPGFGGSAPLVPVRIGGVAGEHRVVRDVKDGALEIRAGDGWKRLWVSTFERDNPIDFVMANHFTATHPSSPFTRIILARAFTATGQVTISNRDVTIDGAKRPLADRRELRAVVHEYFGFDLPELETMRVPMVPEWAA